MRKIRIRRVLPLFRSNHFTTSKLCYVTQTKLPRDCLSSYLTSHLRLAQPSVVFSFPSAKLEMALPDACRFWHFRTLNVKQRNFKETHCIKQTCPAEATQPTFHQKTGRNPPFLSFSAQSRDRRKRKRSMGKVEKSWRCENEPGWKLSSREILLLG